MAVISFMTQKGGTGKSMLTMLAAVELSKFGKVLIVDGDRQGSVNKWRKRCELKGKANEAIHVYGTEDVNEMVSVLTSEEFSDWYVLVDTKGALEDFAIAAAEFSDLCIIPTKPTLGSLEPSIEFYDLMVARGIKTPVRLVFNEVHAFHKNSGSHQSAHKLMQAKGLQYFNTMLFQREVYREIESGAGSFDAINMSKEAVEKARTNVGALLLEIIEFLNGGKNGG